MGKHDPKRATNLPASIREVLQQILDVQGMLHGAGTVSAASLWAIATHVGAIPIRSSAETGCGATTLLLSHLSQNHTVFALDVGQSLSSVRRSALLRPGAVTFIEGPSQRTLPEHRFSQKLQLALIDGPHAYPFPDLEYYFLYPQLESGALLILDDIEIPSIHNLFTFLRADPMFRLQERVRSTAFFIRTDAPTFDPMGDNWQAQPYNSRTLARYDWRLRLKKTFPSAVSRIQSLLPQLRAPDTNCSVEIQSPPRGSRVPGSGTVTGTARLGVDSHLWILVHRRDVEGWWPQGPGELVVGTGGWSVPVNYGGPEDAGFDFEIAAIVVPRIVHQQWVEWVRSVESTGLYPPSQLPGLQARLAADYRIVTRV